MVIFYIFVLIIGLWGVSIRIDKKQYLSKESTNAIKGICILLVFLRHANQYVKESGYDYSCFGDYLFLSVDGFLDQLIVIMFLFFSGYGVVCSIQKKGYSYINSIPKHRVLNTLLNFDVAVFFYIIVALIVGRELSLSNVILSFFAWESIGCSNWYIFVILICYISTWLVFMIRKIDLDITKKIVIQIFLIMVFLIIATVFLVISGKGQWWYNTILVYPLGMFFGIFHKKVEFIVFKGKNYYLIFGACVILFLLSWLPHIVSNIHIPGITLVCWILRIVASIAITIMLMMKFEIGNKFLVWLGVNLFPLYIYQRLPMILLSTFLTSNPFILIPVSFGLTCTIVPAFKKFEIKL